MYRHIFTFLTALTFSHFAAAQDLVPLMDPAEPCKEWQFNNGAEFPGATGSLTAAAGHQPDKKCMKLTGDFTKGGGYVSAGRKLDGVDIRALTMWLRNAEHDQFTIRINDATGQCHQIALKTAPGDQWQQFTFPLEQFFARRGTADAVPGIAKYESWGGAKDGRWHGPATGIYFVVGKRAEGTVRSLWLEDISIVPRPTAVAGAELKAVLKLDEILEGQHDWRFTDGAEFKGAKGSLTIAADTPAAGQSCLKLSGDFTGGGAYVAALKNLGDFDLKDVTAFRFRAKTDNATSIGIQLVDGAGQTHQRKDVKLVADGQWHDVVIKPAEIAGGEHWGGPNDGRWHGAPRLLSISLSAGSDSKGKQPVLFLADVRADALLSVFAQPAAFRNGFEDAAALKPWTIAGGATIDDKTAFKGNAALKLERSLAEVEKPCSVTGPSFSVAPGQWELSFAAKADLHSPDNSYHAAIRLECLNAAGAVVDRFTVAEVFGKRDWQAIKKTVELPKGTTAARFQCQLNKTYGKFWIDELAASYLAPAPQRDDRISRMMFSTAALGNLLLPTDARTIRVTVEAKKPLRESQQTLSYMVRDYWGAEQMKPAEAKLVRGESNGKGIVYEAQFDLAGVPLEVGRYYEVHAAIAQEGAEPFRNYTSLAILPEAETKRYKPAEVPFTARNWDNRISEYIKLSDRLGVRICGLWGGWSAKDPYKPEAPGLDLCKQLGMGWLTNTPAATIERGKTEYDEKALRGGVRNLIEKFGSHRPLIINLGNEPHGKGQRVLDNVAAYRALYEEIKRVDPTIPVVATSVEPNEEYFKAGYGKWCDAFDFHIYEEYPNVRRTINEYRALMKKYDCVKPIWSTELGLNSQGQTRHTVAVELVKKSATFFAAGGENMSWFGLLYPDADGKSAGSSGDSHNVFDCRYNRYCPRLDAVAYYHAVNAIAIKKFVEEKQYADAVNAFLFRDRDDRSLVILWKDKGRQDIALPLPGVKEVEVVCIDGRHSKLTVADGAVTLSASDDPLLILYSGGEKTLPAALAAPRATIKSPSVAIARGGPAKLIVVGREDVDVHAPPFWTVAEPQPVKYADGASGLRFTITPPADTAVREAEFIITLRAAGGPCGELYYRARVSE